MEILHSYAKIDKSEISSLIEKTLGKIHRSRIKYREDVIDKVMNEYNESCWFKCNRLTREQIIEKFSKQPFDPLRYPKIRDSYSDLYSNLEENLLGIRALCKHNNKERFVYINSELMLSINRWNKQMENIGYYCYDSLKHKGLYHTEFSMDDHTINENLVRIHSNGFLNSNSNPFIDFTGLNNKLYRLSK